MNKQEINVAADELQMQLDDEAQKAADLLRSETEEQELATAVNSIFMDPFAQPKVGCHGNFYIISI